jgi:hypothetical protein
MSNGKAYNGSCSWGAVQFTVSGEPAGMGSCHCEPCRSWATMPVNAFTLIEPLRPFHTMLTSMSTQVRGFE